MYRIPQIGSCIKTSISIIRSHGLNPSYVHFPCISLSRCWLVRMPWFCFMSSSSHMITTPLLLSYLDSFDPDILLYWSPMCMALLSKPSSLRFHIVSWNSRDTRRAECRNEDKPDKECHRCKLYEIYQSTHKQPVSTFTTHADGK